MSIYNASNYIAGRCYSYIFAKAVATKPSTNKRSERVTGGATGSPREGGSLSESIYLWYGDDSFPPTSQQTKRFLPLEYMSPILSSKLKHMQWITTVLKSYQETTESCLKERRWGGGGGGGIWSCVPGRKRSETSREKINWGEGSESLILEGAEKAAPAITGRAQVNTEWLHD